MQTQHHWIFTVSVLFLKPNQQCQNTEGIRVKSGIHNVSYQHESSHSDCQFKAWRHHINESLLISQMHDLPWLFSTQVQCHACTLTPTFPQTELWPFLLLKTFAPGSKREQKFFLLHGTFTPRNFRSLELSLPVAGTFARKNESSSDFHSWLSFSGYREH